MGEGKGGQGEDRQRMREGSELKTSRGCYTVVQHTIACPACLRGSDALLDALLDARPGVQTLGCQAVQQAVPARRPHLQLLGVGVGDAVNSLQALPVCLAAPVGGRRLREMGEGSGG